MTTYYLITNTMGSIGYTNTNERVSGIVDIAKWEGTVEFVDSNSALVESRKLFILSYIDKRVYGHAEQWSWVYNGIGYITIAKIDGLEALIDFIIKNREIFRHKDLDLINGLVSASIGGKA